MADEQNIVEGIDQVPSEQPEQEAAAPTGAFEQEAPVAAEPEAAVVPEPPVFEAPVFETPAEASAPEAPEAAAPEAAPLEFEAASEATPEAFVAPAAQEVPAAQEAPAAQETPYQAPAAAVPVPPAPVYPMAEQVPPAPPTPPAPEAYAQPAPAIPVTPPTPPAPTNPYAAAQQVPPAPTYAAAPVPPVSGSYASAVPTPVYSPEQVYGEVNQLTGGMKFGWLLIGVLMGIPGMLLAWLTNADKHPQVKKDAIMWSVIGFVGNILLAIIVSTFLFGIFAAMVSDLYYYF